MIVTIGGRQVQTDTISVEQRFDAIASTFSFTTTEAIDDLFSFPTVEIHRDPHLLLTGVAFVPDITIKPKLETITYSGYSLSGVLEDSNIHTDDYPLQYDNLTLKEIADKLLKSFGIDYRINARINTDMVKKYVKTNASPGSSIKQYLCDLAQQRNIIVTHNELAEIVFTRIYPAEIIPVCQLKEGGQGLSEVRLSVNSQGLHSSITALRQAQKDDESGAEYTISNPYMPYYKPSVVLVNSGDGYDVQAAARAALSKELEGLKIIIKTDQYVSPGDAITLECPSIGLRKAQKLIVEKTSMSSSASDGNSIILTCVLPDVFGDGPVKNIFV